jgi:hypothetical protein
MQAVLASFSVSPNMSMPTNLVQRFPIEIDQCQPDVRLESDSHRVFIECKVDASSDTVQMVKYLALSAFLDDKESPKRPWILYLSAGSLAAHWEPASERVLLQTGGADALRALLRAADMSVLGSGKQIRALRDSIDPLRTAAVLGHSTWTQFCEALQRCATIENPSDLERPLCRIANDFIIDLVRRGLYTGYGAAPTAGSATTRGGAGAER